MLNSGFRCVATMQEIAEAFSVFPVFSEDSQIDIGNPSSLYICFTAPTLLGHHQPVCLSSRLPMLSFISSPTSLTHPCRRWITEILTESGSVMGCVIEDSLAGEVQGAGTRVDAGVGIVSFCKSRRRKRYRVPLSGKTKGGNSVLRVCFLR